MIWSGKAKERSAAAGYMDFEYAQAKRTDDFLQDSLFWYFLGIAEGWPRDAWKYARKRYFEWISDDKDGEEFFKSALKSWINHD